MNDTTTALKRTQHLQAVLTDAGLDAAAIIPGSNLRYLTGSIHYLMERPLVLFVPRVGRPAVVIPSIETELFSGHGYDADLIAWKDAEGYQSAFATAMAQLNLDGKRIGVEGQHIRFFEAEAIRLAAPAATVVDAEQSISSIRLRKDAAEIESLRRAIQISEAALSQTLEQVKVGMTERDVLRLLIRAMHDLGAEGLSFDPIVLAGDNSARPHGKVRDDYAIQHGDPLLFDFGAAVDGFNADITRTVFVGAASDEHRALYAAVQAANAHGRDIAKPGMPAGSLDEQTAQVLRDAGFASLILHRTGHGLGLDVHEAPYIVTGNQAVLEPGMIFTMEPGLYKAGSVGIRIEDNVVITEDGCESLSTFNRDLMIVG
jgi:Xaa-Pro dipeptidase